MAALVSMLCSVIGSEKLRRNNIALVGTWWCSKGVTAGAFGTVPLQI